MSSSKPAEPSAETTEVKEEVVLTPPKVLKTPEDVTNAYLRGEIDEKQLRSGLASYGIIGPEFFGPVDSPWRVDEGFGLKIPEDLFDKVNPAPTTQELIDQANKDQAERDKIAKESASNE